VILLSALGVTLIGVALLVIGPVRWSRDRAADVDRHRVAATTATCIRQLSLEDFLAAGSGGQAEVRSRVDDIAIGAAEARPDVRDAAAALQYEVGSGSQSRIDAARGALAAVCKTP